MDVGPTACRVSTSGLLGSRLFCDMVALLAKGLPAVATVVPSPSARKYGAIDGGIGTLLRSPNHGGRMSTRLFLLVTLVVGMIASAQPAPKPKPAAGKVSVVLVTE